MVPQRKGGGWTPPPPPVHMTRHQPLVTASQHTVRRDTAPNLRRPHSHAPLPQGLCRSSAPFQTPPPAKCRPTTQLHCDCLLPRPASGLLHSQATSAGRGRIPRSIEGGERIFFKKEIDPQHMYSQMISAMWRSFRVSDPPPLTKSRTRIELRWRRTPCEGRRGWGKVAGPHLTSEAPPSQLEGWTTNAPFHAAPPQKVHTCVHPEVPTVILTQRWHPPPPPQSPGSLQGYGRRHPSPEWEGGGESENGAPRTCFSSSTPEAGAAGCGS